jgi:hypothetical protein
MDNGGPRGDASDGTSGVLIVAKVAIVGERRNVIFEGNFNATIRVLSKLFWFRVADMISFCCQLLHRILQKK